MDVILGVDTAELILIMMAPRIYAMISNNLLMSIEKKKSFFLNKHLNKVFYVDF